MNLAPMVAMLIFSNIYHLNTSGVIPKHLTHIECFIAW